MSRVTDHRKLRSAIAVLGVFVIASCTSDDDRAIERRARASMGDALARHEEDSVLRALYQADDERLRWVRPGGWTDEAQELIEAIRSVEQDGLDPAAYGLVEAEQALERARNAELGRRERAAALAEAELAVSRGWSELIGDLRNGASSPDDVMPAWRIAPEEPVDDLTEVWNEQDPAAIIARARPAIPEYARLLHVRATLDSLHRRGGWPEVPEDRVLRTGQEDPGVAAIRARLLASELEQERNDAQEGLGDADRFDPALERAVRSFQRRHLLEETGSLDAATARRLNIPLDEALRMVDMNLERWRWMPHELGRRVILVNLPAYSLQALEDETVVLEMKTVIGKAAWPTPIFADTMTHLVVNPYWNVPESILAEELLPAVRENEAWFDANNYELVDADGSVVDHGSVDWFAIDADSTDLRVRQRPGPGNALGKVKFMFPNQDAVYLHDTPARGLFDERLRAFSHGCVRVAQPMELAGLLLDWSGSGHETFDAALQDDEERRVDLDASIRVYLAYFTVRVGSDGVPRFLDDPYDLDDGMADLVRTTPGSRLAVARGNVTPGD